MKGNIGNMMKQAQMLQANMQKVQAEIAAMEVTGESGGGMVRIIMNGRHEVKALDIDDSLVGDDKEMLEDLLVAAFNDAQRKVEKMFQEKFAGLAGGLNLPPGMKLPF